MSGWDEGQIYVANQGTIAFPEENNFNYHQKFVDFIRNFRDANTFPYRDQLRQNCVLQNYSLRIDLDHLAVFDRKLDLASKIKENPTELIPLFSRAATEVASNLLRSKEFKDGNQDNTDASSQEIDDIQIILDSSQNTVPIRSLVSVHISKLVAVSGIIVSASRKQAKGIELTLMCRHCHAKKYLKCKAGFGGAQIPKVCDANLSSNQSTSGESGRKGGDKCPPDPYVIITEQSKFADHQVLKLQEDPESIPTGEMPRSILLSSEKELCDKAVPGTRLTVLGIYTILHSSGNGRSSNNKQLGGTGIQHAYIRVVGMKIEGSGRLTNRFKPEEENEFNRIARIPNLYSLLASNIAPAIYGHEDIKKALLVQLFGGSRKKLPDGMRIRGDINVLLLGDPGTAKSQMLKFIEKVAPIGVYTSGKGSSAAGLTASVTKDKNTREFYLEGGAMVLADGGIVCIDEFDKMRVHDRVAIHEAMEQQTISIAKAGITTILNSRTSVLAAANPAFGRYDDLRSAAENIEFQSTILSRFDLIFIVKDVLSEATDRKIVRHVLQLHSGQHIEDPETEIPLLKLKRYIAYCKSKCSPRLSAAASEVLKNHYVSIRSTIGKGKENGLNNLPNNASSTIPITVRQLEAIVRISEALAKMSLSDVATEQHVNEAIRLFKVSTYEAATSGAITTESLSPQVMQEVQSAETLLKRRLPIGSQISEKHLIDDFVKQGISEFSVRKAIQVMIQRDEVEYRAQKKRIYRKF